MGVELGCSFFVFNNAFAKATKNQLPDLAISGQSVITADIDQDGDMDLFVGGRIIPDKYPYAPKSHLLINNNGIFEAVEVAVRRLRPDGGERTVGQLVDEIVESKRNRFRSGDLRERSFRDFRHRALKFAASFERFPSRI